MILACLSATIALSASDLCAQTTPGGAREVPAKVIPVPDTVSPQMQTHCRATETGYLGIDTNNDSLRTGPAPRRVAKISPPGTATVNFS